jgi:hypothetical protein
VVIPPKSNRKVPRDDDHDPHKARHLIENFFADILVDILTLTAHGHSMSCLRAGKLGSRPSILQQAALWVPAELEAQSFIRHAFALSFFCSSMPFLVLVEGQPQARSAVDCPLIDQFLF